MQLTYTDKPAALRDGMLADMGPNDVTSTIVHKDTVGGIDPGRLVAKHPAGQGANTRLVTAVLPPTDAVDGILLAKTTDTSIQTITTFDGTIGSDLQPVAAFVKLTLNSHADWDATTAVVAGIGPDGSPVSETLNIPDAGNVTLTTTKAFARVTSLTVAAQSGTNGVYTLGFATTGYALSVGGVAGFSMLDITKEAPATHPPGSAMPLLRDGRIGVKPETAVFDGAPVYVRVIPGVNPSHTVGRVRSDSDSGKCLFLAGATFDQAGTADSIVQMSYKA